jgi:hypothetical protein
VLRHAEAGCIVPASASMPPGDYHLERPAPALFLPATVPSAAPALEWVQAPPREDCHWLSVYRTSDPALAARPAAHVFYPGPAVALQVVNASSASRSG